MESVSCYGTQKLWREKTKAVTANHGLETYESFVGPFGAANAGIGLSIRSVFKNSISRMPQGVE